MNEVIANRRTCYGDSEAPGDFYWIPAEDPSRMSFICPCGCGDLCGVNVKPIEQLGHVIPPWQWNGDMDKPTLTPSIRIGGNNGTEHWHGYLTNGVFKSC